jgi:photosystem II reaction center protein PsbP
MRPRIVATLAVAFAIAAPAGAATSLKPVQVSGFSLRVPSDWQVLKNVGTVKVFAISQQAEGGFRPNVNVVVTPSDSGPPIRIRSALLREFQKAGIKVTSLSTRTVRLPAGSAVELRYQGMMLGKKLTWLAYVVNAHGRAYVVTFTSGRGSYARHAPLFHTIAQSFRIG